MIEELDSESAAIWHILLDAELVGEDQLPEFREEQERTGKSFIQIIYNFGIIDESELLHMMADNLGTELINVKDVNPSTSLLDSFPANIVRMYNVFPIREEDGVIHVAAANPMNFQLIDELGYVLGKPVIILVARPDDIFSAIDHFFPEDVAGSMSDVLADMEGYDYDFDVDDEEADSDEEALMQMVESTPIVRFVNVIIYQAVKDQASDIHFEPFADEFKIRYRIDGALYEMAPPPRHLAMPVVSRVKVVSGLDIAERRHPQDGRIEMRVAGKKIDLRVSTLPTMYGESVVLRILDKGVVNLDLDALGMPDDIKKNLRTCIRKPNGIVLVTGPTGSGKTTTLYSCLAEINEIEDKILTAEDPVEYAIEGLMQVPVNEAIGMTFAAALKAFLRQDPDRIMLGEIRDLTTATMSIQASLTGHLVLSTLHTNDAPSAVTRLVDMGVQPFLITSSIECVLAQRLVRRVCSGENLFYYGKGCDDCNNTGYKGRKGIYELLVLSSDLRKMINKKQPASVLTAQAQEEGMRTLREDGIRSIFTGETSVEEVIKYT
ncbi:MAG: GspE/PulE family protein [Planctomycetota bacterium]|jgi:type IV pilus assembly protein PilB